MIVVVLALAACGEDEPIDVPDQTLESTPADSAGDAEATEGEDTSMSQQPMQWSSPPAMQLEDGVDYRATLKTNKGDITIDLFESEVPKTVNNFVFLAKEGFYSEVPFHRVIKNFMIQTGDPTGTGAGTPGYRFEDESFTRDYERGTVAMANAGPNTNGSQFFIVHGDMQGKLPQDYTIFGKVVDGMDVVDDIANTPVTASPRGEMSVPSEPLFINSVEIATG